MKHDEQEESMNEWIVVTAEELDAWLSAQDWSDWERLK